MNENFTLNRKVFHPGDIIIREGESGNLAYLIQSGKLEVYTKLEGKKIHIAYVGKEEVVGESALIDRGTRSATVEAVDTTVCVGIDKAVFEKKMETADPFLRALFRIMVKRQRNMINILKHT